jgi:TPR repeat protein
VVGACYKFGYGGVAKDYAEAVQLYRLAAAQGHALAQNNLGYMFSKGQGVAQDRAEAIRWYRLAAAQGHAQAKTNLKELGA